MKVEFDNSFEKQILKLTDDSVKNKVLEVIVKAEEAQKLSNIPNVKKLKGHKMYYRIKLGNYRLGFELYPDNTVYLIAFAHRKDVYKKFP